jgi:hypothetical protein
LIDGSTFVQFTTIRKPSLGHADDSFIPSITWDVSLWERVLQNAPRFRQEILGGLLEIVMVPFWYNHRLREVNLD